jgi:hypothetical protein
MESLKIFLLCLVAATGYGILHDQVTARLCVEYFTIGHPPIFGTTSPTMLAFGWGVLATFWCGLVVGLLAIAACRMGPWPKSGAAQLIRPTLLLLLVMACASLLAGIVGYCLAKVGVVRLFGPIAARVPASRHTVFLADLWAHSAAYLVGFVGGALICIRMLLHRWRAATPANMTAALQRAFLKAAALPTEQQDALAAIVLENIAAEDRWQQSCARSQDALSKLAAQTVAEDAEGRTQDMAN